MIKITTVWWANRFAVKNSNIHNSCFNSFGKAIYKPFSKTWMKPRLPVIKESIRNKKTRRQEVDLRQNNELWGKNDKIIPSPHLNNPDIDMTANLCPQKASVFSFPDNSSIIKSINKRSLKMLEKEKEMVRNCKAEEQSLFRLNIEPNWVSAYRPQQCFQGI